MNIDKTLIDEWANLTEAMSIEDILKRSAEIKARHDAERAEEQAKKEQGDVKSITITDVDEDGTIKYVIERKDGSRENCTQEGNFDESEIRKMKRTLSQMSGRTPDDKDIYVALFRSYLSSGAKTPIKWYYEFGRSRGELDDKWFYSPSEDYLGHTPDFVQSLYDNGWSRGI